MIKIETDFKIGTSENPERDIQDVLIKINQCNDCPISDFRTSSEPFAPEYYMPINKIKFALIHQNPMEFDTNYIGYFNPESYYGKIFDDFLRYLGLSRKEMYISSSLFCSDGRKTPKINNVITCLKHKYGEFECLPNLKCVFLMGDVSLKQIIDINFSINDYRFEEFVQEDNSGSEVLFIPIPHVFHYLLFDNQEFRESVITRLSEIKLNFIDKIKGNK